MGILDRFDLTGEAAIITGAGTGLGREMALALAEAGCDIVGVGRRSEPIGAVGVEIRAQGRRYLGCAGTDVTVSAEVDAMVAAAIEAMGRVTILINNAGAGGGGDTAFPELTDEDWRRGIAANLDSAFYCSRAVLPHMLQRGGGRIINVSSVRGLRMRSGYNNVMYAVSKAGVIQLTRALAATYARDNIHCSCIAPGPFPKTSDPATLAQLGRHYPAGRPGLLHEIGPLAVFLASAASDYLSGETVLMDGGSVAAGLTPAGVVPRAEG